MSSKKTTPSKSKPKKGRTTERRTNKETFRKHRKGRVGTQSTGPKVKRKGPKK